MPSCTLAPRIALSAKDGLVIVGYMLTPLINATISRKAIARCGLWSTAPGTQQRIWWVWAFADLVAFAAILGFPLAAALVVRLRDAVRERAWGSFEAATLASLLTATAWGHTRGEVERMWQFLVPFAVVIATRQLLRWRVSLPLVAGLLLAQAVAIEALFYTRW